MFRAGGRGLGFRALSQGGFALHVVDECTLPVGDAQAAFSFTSKGLGFGLDYRV